MNFPQAALREDPNGMLPLHYLAQWGPGGQQGTLNMGVLDMVLVSTGDKAANCDSDGNTAERLARNAEYDGHMDVAKHIASFLHKKGLGSGADPASSGSSSVVEVIRSPQYKNKRPILNINVASPSNQFAPYIEDNIDEDYVSDYNESKNEDEDAEAFEKRLEHNQRALDAANQVDVEKGQAWHQRASFTCYQCQSQVTSVVNAVFHMSTFHPNTDISKHQCILCPRLLPSVSALMIHLWRHFQKALSVPSVQKWIETQFWKCKTCHQDVQGLKAFWDRYGSAIIIVLLAIVVLVAGTNIYSSYRTSQNIKACRNYD